MPLVKVALQSSEMVGTPGVFAWARNGYAFKRDRKKLRNVIAQTFGLTDKCAGELLSGAVQYTVEDEAVVFEYEEGKYLQPK